MSEIVNGKELKGLGGWLVLFQIYLFSNLAGTVQNLVISPILNIFTNNLWSSGISHMSYNSFFDFYKMYNSPLMYIFYSFIFISLLLCVIFFYKKKFIFRTFFIIGSVINVMAMCFIVFYSVNGLGNLYFEMGGNSSMFRGIFAGFYLAVVVIPVIGIYIAFIIALFKSKRVKNTFS